MFKNTNTRNQQFLILKSAKVLHPSACGCLVSHEFNDFIFLLQLNRFWCQLQAGKLKKPNSPNGVSNCKIKVYQDWCPNDMLTWNINLKHFPSQREKSPHATPHYHSLRESGSVHSRSSHGGILSLFMSL